MEGLYFDGELRLRDDLPMPSPAPGEALIKVLAAGICNTDLEIVKGYMDFSGVLGHEFVGVVEAVGANVADFHPGDVVSNIIPFDQIVDFFDHFEENRRKYLKILLKIG